MTVQNFHNLIPGMPSTGQTSTILSGGKRASTHPAVFISKRYCKHISLFALCRQSNPSSGWLCLLVFAEIQEYRFQGHPRRRPYIGALTTMNPLLLVDQLTYSRSVFELHQLYRSIQIDSCCESAVKTIILGCNVGDLWRQPFLRLSTCFLRYSMDEIQIVCFMFRIPKQDNAHI